MAVSVYFLSYSRKNLRDVRIIARTLMIHGVELWQDITNLGTGVSESKIRKAIQEGSDGLIFFVTQQSIESQFIRDVELPEAETRFKDDADFKIIPVFGLPIDVATAALKGCLTVPLSNFNGAIVEGEGNFDDVSTAAHRAAEIVLEDISIPDVDPLTIGLSSKQKTSKDVALHLDFTGFFESGIPPATVWDEQFSAALARVKRFLSKRSRLSIRLHAFCHLSLGILFGYVFRRTTGFKLEIEQITNSNTSIWSTDRTPLDNPLTLAEIPGTLGSKNLLVRMNLMSADDKSVARYVEKNDLSYRAILTLSPPSFPWIISEIQAATIATDLAHKIKEMHARYDTNTVHLFCAIPLGLALMIGYNVNACGTIRCYEFDNPRREYSPSCTLS